jgi:hypothetical protein
VSLLVNVVRVLERERIPHALIGAAALAIRGVSRSTADIDLLTVDARVLQLEDWSGLESGGCELRILVGGADDPLAGSVRLGRAHEIVDIVVGRFSWQRELVEAAEPLSLGELSVPVARAAALVLLKLHAGGPKDAWDIRALFEVSSDVAGLEAEVDAVVSRLPGDARQLWSRLRTEEGQPR